MRFFNVLPSILFSVMLALSASAVPAPAPAPAPAPVPAPMPAPAPVPALLEARSLTARQMVTNIKTITTLSINLQVVASNISVNPITAGRQFQTVIVGFRGIIQTAQTDIQEMSGTDPYGNDDAQLVCNAFREFVHVHQALLNIIIGKTGVLSSLFLGPVAAILRSLEKVVDTLAFGIIDVVPGCKQMAKSDAAALDVTLGKAICACTPGGSLRATC